MTVHRIGCELVLAAAVASLLPGFAMADRQVIDSVAYIRAQRLVSVESDRRLNLYCTGTGAPVVVFDSGLGDSTKAWGLVQPAIAGQTTACSYDRAGLGFSDPANVPGTSENAVEDLRRLLHAANLPAPYILVGHSYGGMNIKLYAETFPSEVAGLVYVDPSHEDLGRDTGRLDPETDIARVNYLEDLKRCLRADRNDLERQLDLKQLCVPSASPLYSEQINAVEAQLGMAPARMSAWISEMTHVWAESADQVRASYRKLGSIPVVVLTKTPSPPVGKETKELRDAKNAMWIRLHNQIAEMTTRGRRVTVAESGHYIQLDQPQVVIDAIGSVIRDAQSHEGAP